MFSEIAFIPILAGQTKHSVDCLVLEALKSFILCMEVLSTSGET